MHKAFTAILAVVAVVSIYMNFITEGEKKELSEDNLKLEKKVKEVQVELEQANKKVDDKVKAIHSHEKKRDEYLQTIEELKNANSEKQSVIAELKAKKMATPTKAKNEVKPRASKEVKASEKRQAETGGSVEVVNGFHSEPVQVENEKSSSTVVGNFTATYYGSDCVGCSGITAGGVNVSGGKTHHNGMRVIAADPSVLPIGTVVSVKGSALGDFTGIVMDTGGAIKGNIIDILVGSEAESSAYGRSSVQVEVLH